MKLYCRGAYSSRYPERNEVLKFDGPGIIDIDDAKAEFLLRDSPGNFTTELPAPEVTGESKTADKSKANKALDKPKANKALEEPDEKK